MAVAVLLPAAFLPAHERELVGRPDLLERPQRPDRPACVFAVVDPEHAGTLSARPVRLPRRPPGAGRVLQRSPTSRYTPTPTSPTRAASTLEHRIRFRWPFALPALGGR